MPYCFREEEESHEPNHKPIKKIHSVPKVTRAKVPETSDVETQSTERTESVKRDSFHIEEVEELKQDLSRVKRLLSFVIKRPPSVFKRSTPSMYVDSVEKDSGVEKTNSKQSTDSISRYPSTYGTDSRRSSVVAPLRKDIIERKWKNQPSSFSRTSNIRKSEPAYHPTSLPGLTGTDSLLKNQEDQASATESTRSQPAVHKLSLPF